VVENLDLDCCRRISRWLRDNQERKVDVVYAGRWMFNGVFVGDDEF